MINFRTFFAGSLVSVMLTNTAAMAVNPHQLAMATVEGQQALQTISWQLNQHLNQKTSKQRFAFGYAIYRLAVKQRNQIFGMSEEAAAKRIQEKADFFEKEDFKVLPESSALESDPESKEDLQSVQSVLGGEGVPLAEIQDQADSDSLKTQTLQDLRSTKRATFVAQLDRALSGVGVIERTDGKVDAISKTEFAKQLFDDSNRGSKIDSGAAIMLIALALIAVAVIFGGVVAVIITWILGGALAAITGFSIYMLVRLLVSGGIC